MICHAHKYSRVLNSDKELVLMYYNVNLDLAATATVRSTKTINWIFSVRHGVQTGAEIHSTSYLTDTSGPFPGG